MIWPLNIIALVLKIGPSEVFSIIEEEESENAYQPYAIEDSSNNGDEVEVATNLLNIVGTFQIIYSLVPTTLMGPFEPSTHFYVEIPLNPPTPIDNQQNELMVNLENSNLELDDLNIPSQTQGVAKLGDLHHNLQASWVHSKSMQNLFFHRFVLVKYECHAIFKHESRVYNFRVQTT
jgi:hypothetical protein